MVNLMLNTFRLAQDLFLFEHSSFSLHTNENMYAALCLQQMETN